MLSKARKPRSGAAAVEFAFMAPVVFLLIFGIFEYGRIILVQQLLENAVRTGARYAVVNTSDSTLTTDTQAIVTSAMCGMQSQLTGFTVSVYQANQTSPFGNSGNAATNATFGQYIGVTASGTFSCAPTTFLGLGNTIPMSATAIMCSEAN